MNPSTPLVSDAQQCSAAAMIKLLLAFCRSEDDKTVSVHNESLLRCAFEEVRKLANFKGTPPMENIHKTHVLKATFTDHPIMIFPDGDSTYGGISLNGCSAGAAGARKRDTGGDKDSRKNPHPKSSEDIKNSNDLTVKFSWPEETRASGVTFINRGKDIREVNELVKDHIPTMHGNTDPPLLTCLTSLIRQPLKRNGRGSRILRVIALRCPLEIKYLDEGNALIAFLDISFCEYSRGSVSSHSTDSMVGHWAPWEAGIEHRGINVSNLMYDPVAKREVTNDLGQAREVGRIGSLVRKMTSKPCRSWLWTYSLGWLLVASCDVATATMPRLSPGVSSTFTSAWPKMAKVELAGSIPTPYRHGS